MNTYAILPGHPFNDFVRTVVGREIRMGDTITFLSEVDLTEVEQLRAASATQGANKPTYTAIVSKAVALALRKFPYANRRLHRRFWLPFSRVRLQQFTSCDVTVAVERNLPGTEVATFIDILRDVERKDLAEITRELRALSVCDETNNRQWRELKWIVTRLPAWLTSALVTRLPLLFPGLWARYRGGAALISAPCKYGVDVIVGAWTAPLGISFGLVKDRPVVRAGKVVPCRTFTLTLNWDRRVMAGAQAARFYKRIVDILEHARTEIAPPAALPRKDDPAFRMLCGRSMQREYQTVVSVEAGAEVNS